MYSPLDELTIVGVYGRGVANQERILIRPSTTDSQPVNLNPYGLMLAYQGMDGALYPMRDNFIWLGNTLVEANSYLLIYTGPGEFRESKLDTGEKVYVSHWGKDRTVLANTTVCPVLFKIDSFQAAAPPLDQLQTAIPDQRDK